MLLQLLERIVDDDELHVRWLNTLSYLEYVGARKIIKSQNEDDIDDRVLLHMAEEIHHALFLRKIIRKHFVTRTLNFSHHCMLAKSAAKAYFKNVDRECFTHAKNPHHAYLLTSYIIETRALKLYSVYQKLLKQRAMFSIASLLSQEERHLDEIKSLLLADSEFLAVHDRILVEEEKFFAQLLESLATS